jgi:hypothetical protein
MTKEYDNTNRGVLFPNDKGDNQNRPDYNGQLSIKATDFAVDESGNVNIRISAWVKVSKAQTEFFSISASPPRK